MEDACSGRHGALTMRHIVTAFLMVAGALLVVATLAAYLQMLAMRH